MNHRLTVELPEWLTELSRHPSEMRDDDQRMAFAINLAAESVRRNYGGPFAAAIFDEHGVLISVGVNAVLPLQNSVLHAEVMAVMFAHQHYRHFSLHDEKLPRHALYTTCAPCAMCMGAVFWSGVSRVICAARKEDAEQLGFNEGPVFSETLSYLQKHGITFTHDIRRREAIDVLQRYQEKGGQIYNATRA